MVSVTFFAALAASVATVIADTPCTPQPDPFAVYDLPPCSNQPTPTPAPSSSTPTPSSSTPSTPAPGSPLSFCTFNGHVLSEYNTGLYTDVVRHNKNEQFVYSATANTIVAQSNGQCLDAFLDGSNKLQLHTYECSATNGNQKWTFNTAMHRIEHVTYTNMCLATGTSVHMEPCGAGVNQFFADCSVPTPVDIRLETCYTKKTLFEYYTGIYANTASNTPNEKFSYDPVAQTIKVGSNGECLDAFQDGSKFGLHTYPCDAINKNQKWVLEGDRVKHATHNNLCLDADPTDGQHKAQVWECFPYNENQCWNIIRAI